MKKSHKITKAIFSSALIIIMGLFVLNNTLFYHVHILPGGKVVSHAHPFGDKDASHGKKHTHTG
ncbi:MAG: hypothetical protein PF450_01775, partial [Bacteroidales bacterium]|nr:hypothetical protein [Bacteroidales bacterium]